MRAKSRIVAEPDHVLSALQADAATHQVAAGVGGLQLQGFLGVGVGLIQVALVQAEQGAQGILHL